MPVTAFDLLLTRRALPVRNLIRATRSRYARREFSEDCFSYSQNAALTLVSYFWIFAALGQTSHFLLLRTKRYPRYSNSWASGLPRSHSLVFCGLCLRPWYERA